jgi:hypothetical protein
MIKQFIAYIIFIISIILIGRFIFYGFVIWYEIIGAIGLICFMGCSFILGYCIGRSK